jgi:Outer membrane protein beta-barrel domain
LPNAIENGQLGEMMKNLILTLLLSGFSIYVWAQDSEQSHQNTANSISEGKNDEHAVHDDRLKTIFVKPANDGSLVLDLGFNFLGGHPAAMDVDILGSRHKQAGLSYNIYLGRTPFVISPGIGVSFDNYEFKDKNITLARAGKGNYTKLQKAKLLLPRSTSIEQSAFSMRYLYFMLEARFNAKNQCPKEGFFVALGGRLDWLWNAATTVIYKEDDETKKQRHTEYFNLNRTRFGFHGKLGWGRFGLCYTHMFSGLFKQGQGPSNSTIKTHSLSLSIDLL